MINVLDFSEIKGYYDLRKNMHEQLRRDFISGDVNSYVGNALGINDSRGNYSASEHGLGQSILAETSANRVFRLAQDLEKCIKSLTFQI